MRLWIGIAACGVYFWRVQDPKGSYAVLYDATDWLTTTLSALFVADGAAVGFLRNALNLILLDQVEGFLIGIAFASLFSALVWPFRAGGRAVVRQARGLRERRRQWGGTEPAPGNPTPPSPDSGRPHADAEPLLLTERINPPPAGSSRPGK